MMPSVLITGSNRGLGLEWVRQYVEDRWRVYATCRHPPEAGELHEIARHSENVTIHRLDITRIDDINALAVELLHEPIDVLVNNAGVYLEKYREIGLQKLNYEDWEHTFRVNTLGTIRVTEGFLDHVARSEKKVVVVISTHMASIADITTSGDYYYRSTKTALNATMEGITQELKPRGIGVLMLHPGWVKTCMGGEDAPILPSESVRGMRALVDRFTAEDSGKFYRYDGAEMPW
jgi:NAD(P)-dependent dehydrogenase (short-subunit alcohol dehydrogenase family)